jgi:transcriptional regulator with XRE-family HTH domain
MRSESESAAIMEARRPKGSQLSGLALIENLYFRAGREAAQNQLQRLLGADQSVRSFALCDVGQPAVGISTIPGDDISYESFNPPVSWNAVYSVQRVRLGPKPKSDYIFHPGEEILIPIQGEVSYHFFWSPGASPPERFVLNPPVGEGQAIRINPQIPHHAWSSNGEAVAWLILRHTMNSPVALVMDRNAAVWPRTQPTTHVSTKDLNFISKGRTFRRRRATAASLRKPGAYAMIAWGISELIRDARLKAGLTPTDLARQIGIDPSSISRLEEAKANVSIEMLARVCSALRIGMAECMESGGWIYDREEMRPATLDHQPITQLSDGKQCLHLSSFFIAKGETRNVSLCEFAETSPLSSWIVLGGRMLVDLPEVMGGKSMILDTSNVMHFKRCGQIGLHALKDSTIVQIKYSPTNDCHA